MTEKWRRFPLSRTAILHSKYFCPQWDDVCQRLEQRTQLYPCACIPKTSLSLSERLSLHSRMSTICPAASACPGSVQAHFPLWPLMEMIFALHLWHQSLHAGFQPPLTFKWRVDLQFVLCHAEPSATGDEERLWERAGRMIAVTFYVCTERCLIWRIRRSSPWGSWG